jgi:hypothetical protein
MELKYYVKTVENAIQLLGLKPEDTRCEEFANWSFTRGSAQILMFLRESESTSGEKATLVITAKIMDIPATNRELLFETLLKYNFRLVNESFCIDKNMVFLTSARFAHGMDPEEVLALLDNLSFAADHLDDHLQEQFKGFSAN